MLFTPFLFKAEIFTVAATLWHTRLKCAYCLFKSWRSWSFTWRRYFSLMLLLATGRNNSTSDSSTLNQMNDECVWDEWMFLGCKIVKADECVFAPAAVHSALLFTVVDLWVFPDQSVSPLCLSNRWSLRSPPLLLLPSTSSLPSPAVTSRLPASRSWCARAQ